MRTIFLCTLLLLLAFAWVGAERKGEAAGDTFGRPRSVVELRGEGGHTLKASGDSEVSAKDGLPVGSWGGEHVGLEVTERGATIEYDCAHGTIGRRIVPDRSGRFDVPGTHTEESGGPIRQDARARGYAVRYTGRVRGRQMSVTVRRGDTGKVIGTYKLVRGQEPSIFKCR
ncbi:MAG: hypothetical protein LC802_15675 [Acidobacteria bacterium]|nr:hypothetical protein [Acidobacteriota bacterium]